MARKKGSAITPTLDELLRSRYHGASNIAGIRFQLLYSVLRLFDLLHDLSASAVQFEGLEDVDVKGIKITDTYIQAKHSGTAKTLSWLDEEKVLDHFIEVYLHEPDAQFLVVTDFALKSLLDDLVRFCSGQLRELPSELWEKIKVIAARSQLEEARINAFLQHVSFYYISEEQLLVQLQEAIIQLFGITAGNEALYLAHLVQCAADWASQRAVINKQQLEKEKVRVQDWIGLGVENPAVRDRLIQPLSLAPEESVKDYYDGKQARIGHILAGLDAPRPTWQQAIEEKLQQVKVCIIKASSGQGKSTLLYRYAYDHFTPDATYRLRVCSREEQIGPIVDYLRTRLSFGLPVLVIIDNLGYSTRLWHQIAVELAGQPVQFLLTTREEDWYRYGFGVSGVVLDFVEPTLKLDEAQAIFSYFTQEDKIASSVSSAEWAYEQVQENPLLLEFVYLITRGQMLSERIQEQVKALQQSGEDPAKLEILRLVSLAQIYGAHVPVSILLQHIQFTQVADATLQALEGEYVTYTENECEGLHLVRSEHLAKALHQFLPREHTLAQLVNILDSTNLAALVSRAFADPDLKLDELLSTLVERSQKAPLSLIGALSEALFVASEDIYFQAHKPLFDKAVAQLGTGSLLLLISATGANGKADALPMLAQQLSNQPSLEVLHELQQQFRSREEMDIYRIPRAFLTESLKNIQLNEHISLRDLGQVSTWCHFFNVSAPHLEAFLTSNHWETTFFQGEGIGASSFLHGLSLLAPPRYKNFITTQRTSLFGQFKLWFRTLSIKEEENNISVEFIVDESTSELHPNDQAVSRLQHLRAWFPQYARYRSQGLYPTWGGQQVPSPDDSHKDMAGETLDLGILHAPRNVHYRKLIEQHYQAVYNWAQKWFQLRQTALDCIRALITSYETVYEQYDANSSIQMIHPPRLGIVGDQLANLLRHQPDLPIRLKDQFSQQQQVISSWSFFLRNFLHQFPQHDLHNSDQQWSRLMRHNLKEAFKRLPEMHRAFAAIFEVEVDHFNMRMLNENEIASYQYLADILDYWFEAPPTQVHHLQTIIQRWRQTQREAFAQNVRVGLASLASTGMDFLYPTGPLYDHPLIGLCLGYKVSDFTQLDGQLVQIIRAIAAINLSYHFLYLST